MTKSKRNLYIALLYAMVLFGCIRYLYFIAKEVMLCHSEYLICISSFFDNDFYVVYILIILPVLFSIYSLTALLLSFFNKNRKLFSIACLILLILLSSYALNFSKNYTHLILLILLVFIFFIDILISKKITSNHNTKN